MTITRTPTAVFGDRNPVPADIATLLDEMLAETGSVETAYQAADAAILSQISAVQSGLSFGGVWSPSGGSFPSGTTAGDYYISDDAGTIDSVEFFAGDWLISLTNGASTSVYASNWFQSKATREIDNIPSYANRAAMIAADVPAGVNFIQCDTPDKRTLAYARDSSGTAATTNSGSVKWSPAGDWTPDHWGENTTPGTTDMQPAIQGALDWADTNGSGAVHFKERGNYAVALPCEVYEKTTVELNNATVKVITGADRAFRAQGENVTIRNGKCDIGFLGAGVTTQYDYTTVEKVEVLNASSTAISFLNCSNSVARGNHVWWDSTGVSARVSAGTALYGITTLVTTDEYESTDALFERNKVDFRNFTAAQMESVDACILMRGDEVSGTYTKGKRFTAHRNETYMPIGERDVTYGSSLPRPTGIEIRTVTDAYCTKNICDGGDLTNSFGRVSRGLIEKCTSTNQTHYCAEVAQACREVTISENQFQSNLALQLVSITDCNGYSLSDNMIQGGDDSASDCIRLQGSDTNGTISGGRIVPTASGSDGIDINDGASATVMGVNFFSSTSGAGGFIHVSASGTVPDLALAFCPFEGVATRPVKISGTVSHLAVGFCRGIGTPLASDLATGTVTASTYANNNNLTGL